MGWRRRSSTVSGGVGVVPRGSASGKAATGTRAGARHRARPRAVSELVLVWARWRRGGARRGGGGVLVLRRMHF